MSRKFHLNEKVRIKSTGNIGVIKSRDVIRKDDNHVEVEYIVKEGSGINNWHSYSKSDIEALHGNTVYPKLFYKEYEIDKRKITLCAEVNKVYKTYNGKDYVKNAKILRIGYAICHPGDTYDKITGEKIAKRRASSTPFCDLFSPFGGEFQNEFVDTIVDAKAKYIMENIEKFIAKKKD